MNISKANRCYGVSNDEKGAKYIRSRISRVLIKKTSSRKAGKISLASLEIMLLLNNKNIVHREIKPENFLITNNGV